MSHPERDTAVIYLTDAFTKGIDCPNRRAVALSVVAPTKDACAARVLDAIGVSEYPADMESKRNAATRALDQYLTNGNAPAGIVAYAAAKARTTNFTNQTRINNTLSPRALLLGS